MMIQQNSKINNIALENIVNISWDNLYAIKPEWLANEDILLKIKVFVFEVIAFDNIFEAMECFNTIQDLLNKISKQNIVRPDIFMEYLRLLAVLKSGFLINLNNQDLEVFFQENLLFCIEVADFDLKEQVFKLMNLFRKDKSEFEFYRHIILSGLETNQEFLGTTFIQKYNKNWPDEPKVANWIQDYKEFCVSSVINSNLDKFTKKIGAPGGGFERISYLEKSKEARTLSQDEKNILMRVLDFYDWIKNIKPGDKYSPYENEDATSYMVVQSGRLDDIPETTAKAEPSVDVPKKNEEKFSVANIELQQASSSVVPSQAKIVEEALPKPAVVPEPKLTSSPLPPVQPIEIEIEVPPGISFGPMPSVSPSPNPLPQGRRENVNSIQDVKSEIEQKKKLLENEINKKIEDLKKKTQ